MGRAIGRTFKVTGKQIRSYEPVSAPRGRARMKANPIGVTTLAQVNGRGAASARVAARGKSRSQRLSHARELLGGSSMKKNRSRAAFVRPKKATAKKVKMTANAKKAAGKRLAAYNSARKRGMSEKSAARSALRKAPFTANERSRGVTFKGSKARKMRPNRSSTVGGGGSAYAEGWEQAFGGGSSSTATSTPKKKKKAKSMAGKKKKGAAKKSKKKTKKAKRKSTPAQFRTVKKTVKTKKRVAFGQYKRVKLINPRTGRYEYSYMYRTKSGKMRRIPTDAVLRDASGKSSSVKAKQKMDAARKRAADRILKEGGAFVPNAKKRKTRAALRRNYFNKLLRAGEGKASAKSKAMRKFPYTVSEKSRDYKFESGVGKKRKKTKSKTKRKGTKRKGTKRKSSKRKATKRTTSKRKGTKRKSSKRKGTKRKGTKRKATKRKSSKRKGTKRKATKRKTKRKGKMRKNGRKSMRANGRRRGRYTMNSFMADMKMVLKSGALIATGFLVHRVLTSLAAEYLLGPVISPKDAEPNLALKKWEKPIAGAVVATAGIALTGAAIKGPERVMIGGGMLASLLQSVVVSALMAADQPQVASRLEGYSNSMAYQLRGRRRRGMGAMTSIMPRYAQLSGFQQAAAGFGGGSMSGRRGTGEYFTGTAGFMQAAAGTGEYFAAPSLKGVGGYEPAGPLVMQASAGVGQKPIDDGIRPDTNLDRVLDLAESAAGVGEYLTAQPDNGGWAEDRVPTQSQWIPNGPLWAGELKVKGNVESSELPAGILAMPGGNGILS